MCSMHVDSEKALTSRCVPRVVVALDNPELYGWALLVRSWGTTKRSLNLFVMAVSSLVTLV